MRFMLGGATLFGGCKPSDRPSDDHELSISGDELKTFCYTKKDGAWILQSGASEGDEAGHVTRGPSLSSVPLALLALANMENDDLRDELSTALDNEEKATAPVEGTEAVPENKAPAGETCTDSVPASVEPAVPASLADPPVEGPYQAAAVPAAPADPRIEQLKERLADVLASSACARTTIERFGGYQSCFDRFLKSSKNKVDAAEQKLLKTFEFRESMAVNTVLEDPVALKAYDEMQEVWPEAILGSTKDGSPVSYFELSKAVKFLKAGYTEDQIRTYWLVCMEKSLQMQRQGRPDGARSMPANVIVYNLSGLNLWQLSSCASGLKIFCRVISLGEEHYPQMLRKAVVTHVPSFFSKMVWPVVQKVLDAETSSNVCITSSGYDSLTSAQLGFGSDELHNLMMNLKT